MNSKITILISEDLHRKAKVAAAQRSVTLSAVIRDALERFVAETEALRTSGKLHLGEKEMEE